MRRAIVSCGGVCDWEVSRLAAFCGISPRQFTRDMGAIAPRWIIKIERKGPDGKNLTNLLMLPALPAQVWVTKMAGKKLELLTLLPLHRRAKRIRAPGIPPVELPKPAPVREQWEARRAQDREDHHRMRERYDAVGRELLEEKRRVSEQNRRWWREGERHRWSGGRAHRLAMADDRARRASEANVGVFRGRMRAPLIERHMTRRDCLDWLDERGTVPHEVPRSACVFCPFHDDAAKRLAVPGRLARAVR